jgi:hypothetical protein
METEGLVRERSKEGARHPKTETEEQRMQEEKRKEH